MFYAVHEMLHTCTRVPVYTCMYCYMANGHEDPGSQQSGGGGGGGKDIRGTAQHIIMGRP